MAYKVIDVSEFQGLIAGSEQFHIIQPGETLSGIALRYGTTVAALAALSNIPDPNRIYAGDRLRIR